jgi:hypothetical protein
MRRKTIDMRRHVVAYRKHPMSVLVRVVFSRFVLSSPAGRISCTSRLNNIAGTDQRGLSIRGAAGKARIEGCFDFGRCVEGYVHGSHRSEKGKGCVGWRGGRGRDWSTRGMRGRDGVLGAVKLWRGWGLDVDVIVSLCSNPLSWRSELKNRPSCLKFADRHL